jgi:hypothetical protein
MVVKFSGTLLEKTRIFKVCGRLLEFADGCESSRGAKGENRSLIQRFFF